MERREFSLHPFRTVFDLMGVSLISSFTVLNVISFCFIAWITYSFTSSSLYGVDSVIYLMRGYSRRLRPWLGFVDGDAGWGESFGGKSFWIGVDGDDGIFTGVGLSRETETEQALSLFWTFATESSDGSIVREAGAAFIFFTCVLGTFIFVPMSFLSVVSCLVCFSDGCSVCAVFSMGLSVCATISGRDWAGGS